ncbi:uncharacterized protein [Miscanthus floridulus]|uniref:uncharacterized protein n=1 Tax=Miscanthus floridulus TaxID=154761 RepID=UPI003457D09A
MEVPTLAPLKALKVNPSSTAHWVAEAQAALQRSAASARADPKEPATQGGAIEAAPTQAGEGAPPPHDGEAHGLDGAAVPLATEATEIEVPGVSQAKALEAKAPRTAEATAVVAEAPTTTEATIAEAGAPGTIEAMMAEAEAPETTEADVIAARLSAQEVEMKVAEASVAPLGQGPLSSWEGAQKVELEKEVTQAAEASAAVQAVLETKIREHDALKSTAYTTYKALEVEGVQSGSSLRSRLITLSGQAISIGYVLPDDEEEADEVVAKLIEAAKGPSTALAKLFEEEVVPLPSSVDAGGPEP